jgi:hypothetical protein
LPNARKWAVVVVFPLQNAWTIATLFLRPRNSDSKAGGWGMARKGATNADYDIYTRG